MRRLGINGVGDGLEYPRKTIRFHLLPGPLIELLNLSDIVSYPGLLSIHAIQYRSENLQKPKETDERNKTWSPSLVSVPALKHHCGRWLLE